MTRRSPKNIRVATTTSFCRVFACAVRLKKTAKPWSSAICIMIFTMTTLVLGGSGMEAARPHICGQNLKREVARRFALALRSTRAEV